MSLDMACVCHPHHPQHTRHNYLHNLHILTRAAAYTTFSYSDLKVRLQARAGPAHGPTVPGGAQELFAPVGRVSVLVANSGAVAGAEVAQLYIGFPASAPRTPPKQLRGFDKLLLAPGQRARATFDLARRDISYWDSAAQAWVVPRGVFRVYVGSSSRDIRLVGSFRVGWF